MFKQLASFVSNVFSFSKEVAQIKNSVPKGNFLAYVEVRHPGGALFCQDPVLVKKDPRRFSCAQEAAYIFPGFEEPMLYANEVKGIEEVKPFGHSNYLHYAKDPEMLHQFIKNISEAKVALDDQREIITIASKKAVEDLKVKINGILGDQYFLLEVGTMLGTLPVITKINTGTNKEIPCAHIYPGEQTDALDGAPKKTTERCSTMPTAEMNRWLANNGEKVLPKIQEAIVQLERPEKFINWYEPKE